MASVAKQRNFDVGFFDDQPTKDAIKIISDSDRITIFAGAGVSADQDYPSWAGLVRRVLASKLQDYLSGVMQAEVDSVSRAIIGEYYQIPTATILDQLYRESNVLLTTPSRDVAGLSAQAISRRNEDLRQMLYSSASSGRPASPALVSEIVHLAYILKAAGKSVHIVTTNYDDLLETAASECPEGLESYEISHKTFADAPPNEDDEDTFEQAFPIVHVHGFLPRPGGGSKAVIFSEGDYIDWDQNSPFRSYLESSFSKGCVLMVGTSLRDSNIAAKLRAMRTKECARYALMPAVQETKVMASYETSIGKSTTAVTQAFANYAVLRGEQLGVTILRPDYYGQVMQFLREVRLAVSRGKGDVDQTYSLRLRRWADAWNMTRGSNQEWAQYTSDELSGISDVTKRKLSSAVDAVKVELWVRSQPDARNLELWADSEGCRAVHRPGYRPHLEPLDALSDHPAIRCFASRSAVDGRMNGGRRRLWTHYVAVPLDQEEWVPTGVLVILMNAPRSSEDEFLATVRKNWPWLTETMVDRGTPLLSVA